MRLGDFCKNTFCKLFTNFNNGRMPTIAFVLKSCRFENVLFYLSLVLDKTKKIVYRLVNKITFCKIFFLLEEIN